MSSCPHVRTWTRLLLLVWCKGLVGGSCNSFSSFFFEVTEARTPAPAVLYCIQMSELMLYGADSLLVRPDAVHGISGATWNQNEGPEKVFDGDHTTKYCDKTSQAQYGSFSFSFNQPVSIHSYSWVTGNDGCERDPVSWNLQGQNSSGLYSLDVRTRVGWQIPKGRRETTGHWNMECSDHRPSCSSYDLSAHPLFLWTTAEDYDNTQGRFEDKSGNQRHGDLTAGAVTSGSSAGNGAFIQVPYVQGSTSSKIHWPGGSVPNSYTICSVTRYAGAGRKRILDANGPNWLHGHHSGYAGSTYYQGTAPSTVV